MHKNIELQCTDLVNKETKEILIALLGLRVNIYCMQRLEELTRR